jgi:hypothetical protein
LKTISCGIDIDLVDLAEKHLHVGRRCRSSAAGATATSASADQARGHLVEERLEQVEVALVDQGDPHRLADQAMGGPQARRSHPPTITTWGQLAWGGCRWIEFQQNRSGAMVLDS